LTEGKKKREKKQPSFSDVVLQEDEELETQLRIVLDNEPTPEEIARRKLRNKASKRVRAILLDRHKTDCEEATEKKEWIRIADIGFIQPQVIHHQEETKPVTYWPGGKTTITVGVQPVSFQLQFGQESADPIQL
jgi:hypothetical protein